VRLNAMLEREQARLIPAEKERIGKMLAVVAKMIGAPIPDAETLALYIRFLGEYPQDLIDQMGEYVIRHHKYNTFPRVADFEEPVREQLFWRKQAVKETIETRKMYCLD